ncbi:MAG TPA: hypothetical protein DCQ09_04955 [Alcanivorax sp.]|nr:hypothetical protein [Alcanivorax sp.]
MATLEQLERGIRAADKAGNAEDVRRLGAEYRRMQREQQEPSEAGTTAEKRQLRPEQFGDIGGFQVPNELEGDSTAAGRFKVAAGLMSTNDPDRQMRIIAQEFPGVAFDKDEEGNFIVDARAIGGTRGYLNEPGLDSRDAIKFAGNVLSFLPAGRVAGAGSLAMQGARVGAASGATQGLMDLGNQALGGTSEVSVGNINPAEVAAAAVGGGAGQVVGSKIGGAVARGLERRAVNKQLQAAAPSTDALKGASRDIYAELDNMGVSIDQPAVGRLGQRVINRMKSEGFHPQIHPKVSGALKGFMDTAKKSPTLTEMQTLRKIAQSAAQSNEPAEARLGSMLVDEVDNFIENVPAGAVKGVNDGAEVAGRLKAARSLWGRAKKSEMLSQAVDKAQNQASGFENGLRVQFRSLLNNPRKMRGFTSEEKDAIRKVVQGGKPENVLRAMGKLGFSTDQSSSMLLATLGIGGGGLVGGTPGAMAVPALGTLARQQAERVTRQNAGLADALTRAGKDGKAIAAAYLRNVPKKDRSIDELTGLLLREGTNWQSAGRVGDKLAKDASFAANIISAVGASAGEGIGSIPPVGDQFDSDAEDANGR